MKIHLISYGDDKFASQKAFFKETAVASGFFDEITIYSPQDIDNSFVTRFQTILNTKRGGGYWIWKPYFVKKALDALNDGDILIYCDAGCMVNSRARKRFNEYVEMLEASKTGSIAFELPHKETEYTKQEIFDFFGSPANAIETNQLMATIILFKKCSHATMLVDKWYSTFCEFPMSFLDDYYPEIQRPEFISNRYDQSMFSMIRKIYGSDIIPDETYFLDFIREGQEYPLWATRIRG